jgi:hypothetical protein
MTKKITLEHVNFKGKLHITLRKHSIFIVSEYKPLGFTLKINHPGLVDDIYGNGVEATVHHHLVTVEEALSMSPMTFWDTWGNRRDSVVKEVMAFQAERATAGMALVDYLGGYEALRRVNRMLHDILESRRLEDAQVQAWVIPKKWDKS